MVFVKWTTVFECPLCQNWYIEIDEAKECLDSHNDSPICIDIKTARVFECEMCGKIFKYEDYAEECEDEHKRNKDFYYNDYLRRLESERMSEIANRKGQIKINEFSGE